MLLRSLLLAAFLSHGFALPTEQAPLIEEPSDDGARAGRSTFSKGRQLKGKFLHITDFHPDGHYKPYASTAKECACHRGNGPAGFFGAETSDCDTPTTLVNATFQWINDNIRDEVDFVIWTGDSARHDSDEQIPRTQKEVLDLNIMLVDKFVEVFGKEGEKQNAQSINEMATPIVPTFGNNDILPHNILYPGPNTWTRQFSNIWKNFIPEEQRHGFERGGWFFVEVIPHRLAVFSLNTLYFFDSNSAVDGCVYKSEPGYEQMEWLRIQLQFLRERGVKAIITGHVPPARTDSKQSWDETCWQKYALWMKQYRDVVVGSVYGHMNIDHFMLQDFKDIKKKTLEGYSISPEKESRMAINSDDMSTQTKSDYLAELRTDWSQIPDPPKSKRKSKSCKGFFCVLVDYVNELRVELAKVPGPPEVQSASMSCMNRVQDLIRKVRNISKKHNKSKEEKYLEKIGGPWGENYALTLVSPSVVPNYYPTMRVVEYNISGLDLASISISRSMPEPIDSTNEKNLDASDNDDNTISPSKKKKNKKHHKHKKSKPKFTLPFPPSKSSPPGPAYSPQVFTWLGYTQYYANLTRINNDFPNDTNEISPAKKWREGKHSGKNPPGKDKNGGGHHHAAFYFEVEYDTRNDSVWGLGDMTMRSYLQLARGIGRYKASKQSGGWWSEDAEDVDVDAGTESKKSKKKKHKKKKKQKKVNEIWFNFIRRAFVGAVDDDTLREEFGMV